METRKASVYAQAQLLLELRNAQQREKMLSDTPSTHPVMVDSAQEHAIKALILDAICDDIITGRYDNIGTGGGVMS